MFKALIVILLAAAFSVGAAAQVPQETLLRIVRAEDQLNFDEELSKLLSSEIADIRVRAALAAGRIGDDAAIPALESLLGDESVEVAATAMFALGEIESAKASASILKVLNLENAKAELLARAIEAAGKIVAANRTHESSEPLGELILDVLEAEDKKGDRQSSDVIVLGLTAALRAKPADADFVIAKFFVNKDARVRADAVNAYVRVQGKTAVKKLQSMLLVDEDPVSRANAARALGSAGDKTALNMLLEAAESDDDQRVRVSAVRSAGALAEPATAERLIRRAKAVLADYERSEFTVPVEQNELLELGVAVGRAAKATGSAAALNFLKELSEKLRYSAGEIESAIAAVAPAEYVDHLKSISKESESDWRVVQATTSGLGAIDDFLNDAKNKEIRTAALDILRKRMEFIGKVAEGKPDLLMSLPGVISVYSNLKADDADVLLRKYLAHRDVFVRSAAASALGDRPAIRENVKALDEAFGKSLETDKDYDDAQLSILSALVKLDKEKARPSIGIALKHYDLLVRRQALQLIKSNGLEKDFPGASALAGGVRNHSESTYSKLGQLLNSDADYRRALSRKNGQTKAIIRTEKGSITIYLFPEDAPLTVDNFIKLARKGYFGNISIHRVVPNFVVQDGDPRGDGNGGPGWQIRCEINTIPYGRGMVGMALSGKDTGGSQWFVTHSPQPHLDGGYTVFGKVDDAGMKVVDMLAKGDVITSIEIVE